MQNTNFRYGKRPPYHNKPVVPSDPIVQHITMMALMSRPGIEQQLEEAINLIDGIANTIRTLRRGMEHFNTSMREAQQHMVNLPKSMPISNKPQQPAEDLNKQQYNNYENINTLPLNNNQQNDPEQSM